jgi:CRP-like cAMP-binding protein
MSATDPSSTPIAATGLFAGLSDDDLAKIRAIGVPASFAPDQAVFEAGDTGDGMYIVLAGEARVDVGGRFHILKTGDFFGEMALITPEKRMATVRAVGDLETLKIPADGFRAFILEHPTVALAMMKALVIRLREVEQRIDAWMA